jgi:hypothetical protein
MNTDGYPVVLKSHVESVLSGSAARRTAERKKFVTQLRSGG